jgi:hypothetical protein
MTHPRRHQARRIPDLPFRREKPGVAFPDHIRVIRYHPLTIAARTGRGRAYNNRYVAISIMHFILLSN